MHALYLTFRKDLEVFGDQLASLIDGFDHEFEAGIIAASKLPRTFFRASLRNDVEDIELIEVWAREVAASDNHVVGPLAMMLKGSGGAVDTRMKMYGIEAVGAAGEIRLFSITAMTSS